MRRLRAPRGGALVEMVILVIVLVPVIMYYLFLEDALFFKLNAQEPVVSAPFDLITANFNLPGQDSKIQDYNRLIFCDHSSAYDSSGAAGSNENQYFDCQGADRGHHTEAGAHECWITSGAQQVTCTTSDDDRKAGTSILAGPSTEWVKAYSKGGLTTCTDRIGVMNYIIITQFFSWSARGGNVTGGSFGDELRHNTRWAHADKDASTAHNQILMAQQKLAVLTDPWALNRLAEVTPDGEVMATMSGVLPGGASERRLEANSGTGRLNRLSNRSGTYYLYYGGRSSRGNGALTSVKDFFDSAKGKFLTEDARTDGMGDDPETLPVLYKEEKTRAGANGYASGWADSRVSGTNRPNSYPANW